MDFDEEAPSTQLLTHREELDDGTQTVDDECDDNMIYEGRYPTSLVNTAVAVLEEVKPGPLCTWCGSRSCASVVKGNQCTLVWINNRTGVTLLSTRKFGMLKQASVPGYEAAFKEALENGVLRGAPAKDLEEFKSLVDESMRFYEARDEQYRESRAQTPNPYPPRQDARQPGGYQNGSAYPSGQRNMWPNAGQQRTMAGTSPYAAFNPRSN
jgi:hypothetical protein